MRKSEGQKIPEKEIVKQKFCKNFERGRLLVRRARRCNREDLEQFQFAESTVQILRRDNQRIAFRETQTIYIENPLKSCNFSGFSGPSDWFRTSGLVVPNRNRKLFSGVSNAFLSFPLVFRYSRDLFGTPISACSARVCSNPCGQKTLPDKKDGKRFLCSRCLHCSSGQRVMQVVSEEGQLKDCATIDKE